MQRERNNTLILPLLMHLKYQFYNNEQETATYFFTVTFAVWSGYNTIKCRDCILWLNQLRTWSVWKFHITKSIQTMEIFKLSCISVIANNQRPFSTSVNWNLCKQSTFLIRHTVIGHYWWQHIYTGDNQTQIFPQLWVWNMCPPEHLKSREHTNKSMLHRDFYW